MLPLLGSSTLTITELHPIFFGSKARVQLITQCNHLKAKLGILLASPPGQSHGKPRALKHCYEGLGVESRKLRSCSHLDGFFIFQH